MEVGRGQRPAITLERFLEGFRPEQEGTGIRPHKREVTIIIIDRERNMRLIRRVFPLRPVPAELRMTLAQFPGSENQDSHAAEMADQPSASWRHGQMAGACRNLSPWDRLAAERDRHMQR